MFFCLAMLPISFSSIMFIFLAISSLFEKESTINTSIFISICAVSLTVFVISVKALQYFSKCILQNRITELETELAACREQLEEARREISGKEEGHETAHGEDFPAEYEGHGIFTMVAKLVDERAPVEDIMRLLADEKDFLSNKETGYFFHPSPEGKAVSTLQNYVKNKVKKG